MKRILPFYLIFFLAATLSYAQVIINEISYNPPESGNDSLEYIELYNAGDVMVSIGGWYYSGGVEDTLPDIDLQPGDYYVSGVNAGALFNVFGITADQWSGGALSNGGEVIRLVDAGGNLIDSVLYDDADPWPLEPDGSGPSLELRSPEMDNNDGANWQFSGGATGVIIEGNEVKGTPGAQNSGGGTPGPDLTIDLANFSFVPMVAVVQVGHTVRWVNNSGIAHNVNGQASTFPGNPDSFFSGPAAPGPWQFDFTFTVAGTYQYQCDPHAGAGMRGTIYVYDPLSYNDFALPTLRLVNENGSALFDGVPTTVTGIVHGINFQPTGYSFYVINPNNVGINVFSFDPGAYVVTEGDEVLVSGVIDQFNGLLEIIPDDIQVLSTGNSLVDSPLIDEVTESEEGSHLASYPFEIDSIVATGTSGYNVFVTHEAGKNILIRVDADLGLDEMDIQGSNAVRGIGTQFDNQFPFTDGYQILALELVIVSSVPRLESDAISLSPNPAGDVIRLSGQYILQQVDIYGMDGRQLASYTPNATSYVMNVSALPSGIHQIKATTPEGVWSSLISIVR